jgi:tripartite ATP-independent transporter DctM subunit
MEGGRPRGDGVGGAVGAAPDGELLPAVEIGQAPPRELPPVSAPGERDPPRGLLGRLEESLPVLALLVMVALPLAEIVARRLGTGIPGAAPILQHLTLWVAFLGAAIAARDGKLLALATGTLFRPGAGRELAAGIAGAVGAGVSALLARASVEMVLIEREGGAIVAEKLPAWMAQLCIPFAFAAIALRLFWHASPRWWAKGIALLGLAGGLYLGQYPGLLEGKPAWPGMAVILVATLLGSPVFAVLGGLAVVLFMRDGVPIAAVPAETYRLAVSPLLAAIPLFTLGGFLLAEGRSSVRLLAVFRSLFGWIPGGTAVVCALVCAFFTIFTGGSGVTILALGGLMFPALLAEKYPERFSLGLLTASGSLGLLWPPALPLILYGIVASVPIEDIFIGGLLPGLLMATLIAGWGVRQGSVSGVPRQPFAARQALRTMWVAKWELLLPAIVLVAIFGGFATLVETSAITALYVLFVKVVVHRDIRNARQLFGAFRDCITLVGGVMVILGAAMGFTSYLVDAEVPARFLEYVQAHVESKWLFLLGLNVFLLFAGSVMEIFAAIIVVVPLLAPLGAAYGIHPVHLAIIFIANLELGYLTPPVGLNLFLASYRFKRPLVSVYRASLPFLVLGGIGVLLITYVPWLTTWLLELMGRGAPALPGP